FRGAHLAPNSDVAMAEPAPSRPMGESQIMGESQMGESQADREALEHIARAVQGRVLRGPGSLTPAGALGLETLALNRPSIDALLEAMPAAIAILAHGTLIHANAAFAYAFGYRSQEELQSAGGLDAILPGGASLLRGSPQPGQSFVAAVDALTRGRRRLKV